MKLLVLCLLVLKFVHSARILGFFMIPSISHQKVYQPIWKELSLRGHEVTVVSPNVLNETGLTNLTEIDVNFSYDVFERHNFVTKLGTLTNIFKRIQFSHDVLLEVILEQLEYEPVKKIIQDKEREFDLVLVEAHHPILYAFGGRFKAPLIVISSLGLFLDVHDAVGNPSHPVIHPDIFATIDSHSIFLQSLISLIYSIWYRIYFYCTYLPKLDRIAKQYFGDDLPHIIDLQKNISLVITNVNPVTHKVRPNVPTVIEISQIHIAETKPLPEELQIFLDSSPEGVIYFSLGSNIKSANLSINLRETILETFAELPYKILWKWEADHLPNQPKNVLTKKWLPQLDVLSHPNIKAFITQAGLQSIEEAISREVPMLAFPFAGDQMQNAKRIASLEIALEINYKELSRTIFKKAILEIAENRKYKNNIQRIHQQLIDQPISGLEKAIWWIEYVIRNGGTKHLRSEAVDMPLYKYLMLDVIAFLTLCLYMSYRFIVKIISICRKTPQQVKIKKC